MKKLGAELKRHALTAISYMLPLVVASGLLTAVSYTHLDVYKRQYIFLP